MQTKSSPKGKNSTSRESVRINLTIAKGLLKRVDKAAYEDYTTRSEFIRQALLDYLRVPGIKSEKLDPDNVLKALKRREANAAANKMLREIKLTDK